MATQKKLTPITSVDQLADQLGSYSYKPRTEAERRAEAEGMYANSHAQALLQAQQSYETGDQALADQLATLGTGYDRKVESQQKQNAQTVAASDRAAASRGMGRSSFNNATRANVMLQGDKAIAQIQEDRAAAENSIQGQRALLANQYRQNINAADSAYENNVLARMRELESQDYDRTNAATQNENNLLFQLYGLQQKSSSGGSSATPPTTPPAAGGNQDGSLLDQLTGNGRDYSYNRPRTQNENRKNPNRRNPVTRN